MRLLMSALLGLFFLPIFAGYTQAEEKIQPVPKIEVDKATYEFNQVSQGEVVKVPVRFEVI